MGNVLCEHCTAACCRYVALPIERPENARDFDDMRWYVIHDNIAVFVENDDWFIQIHNPCKHIRPDGGCAIYETRPAICRQYATKECDYLIGDEARGPYFDNPEELQAYAKEFLRKEQAEAKAKTGPSTKKKRTRRAPKGAGASRPRLARSSLAGARK